MLRNLMGILLFLISISSFATPPKFVYRVDTRSPKTIFKDGFKAWGNNHNIVAHINGATCLTSGSTSAFISTAANIDAALAIVQTHLNEGRVSYLYTARADDTFYNGPESVDYFQQFNPLSPLSIMSLEMARRADEWDAIGEIPPENIQEATEYRPTGETQDFSNSRYLNIDTTGNSSPYTNHSEETLAHYGFPVELPNMANTMLGACFQFCFDSRQSNTQSKEGLFANNNCSTSNENIINLNITLLSILQEE